MDTVMFAATGKGGLCSQQRAATRGQCLKRRCLCFCLLNHSKIHPTTGFASYQRRHVNRGVLRKLRAADRLSDPASPNEEEVYPLEKTKVLVETAMLAAVTGIAYVLATTVKLENSLGYFLPLPVLVAAMRGGVQAGFRAMAATAVLLLVLLGPMRAVAYFLVHGMLSASLGAMWYAKVPWAVSVPVGALVRMAGQLGSWVLTSWAMNENLFLMLVANVHSMLDQISATIGVSGAPSTLAVSCMIFALMLVNGISYVFLLHILHRIILQQMGFNMGKLPALIEKWLFSGMIHQ